MLESFGQMKLSDGKLKTFGWVGWILLLINFPAMTWIIRPYPSTDENTVWVILLWLTGLLMATWSLAGFKWNAVMNLGDKALDEPKWAREQGGKNTFEEEVDSLSNAVRYSRNAALAFMAVGLLMLMSVWQDQNSYSCNVNYDGEVTCSNTMAYGAGLLLIGVVLASAWGFYSNRFMNYMNVVQPLVAEEQRKRETHGDEGWIDPFHLG